MPEITIERLGHHGDGIAAGPVYVPLSLPGEIVTGEVTGDRMPTPKIVTPSCDRVAAPCRHFRSCGGCVLQHASDSFVTDWKAGVVRTALAAQGLDAPIRAVHTSPPRSRRRAVLSGRRTKKGALVGFHARASDTIVPVPDCEVLVPEIVSILPELERLTVLLGSRKGTLKFAVTATETGLDLAITGAKAPDPQTRMALGQVPVARLTVDGDPIAHHNPPTIHIDGIPVTPPPGAFLQATEHGEGALLAAVKDIIGDATTAVDLFAGCGTFALPLAKGAEVHAVEGQAELTDAMTTAWRGAQLKRMTTETRDLFRRPLVQSELKYAAAVIDPPRAGAEAQVAEFAGSQIPRIAMVSCNPVTFARDAKALIHAGFTLNWIEVVDQFRWSPHIELVGSFTR